MTIIDFAKQIFFCSAKITVTAQLVQTGQGPRIILQVIQML